MNTTTVIYMTLMGFLLLYLINRQKKDVKSGNKLYNPFAISKNQTRRIVDYMNNEKFKKIEKDDDKWINDDITSKRCYNLCQSNYMNDYKKCIKSCNQYNKFNLNNF